jgi:hypothetical protein
MQTTLKKPKREKPVVKYQVYSYGDTSSARRDQKNHGQFADRLDAERECRAQVTEHGRRSAHVMRLDDGTFVYHFDQLELG